MKYFVHERAVCDSTNIGEGTRIWGFSHVMAGARLGRECNVGEHVFIENKVIIGDGCTIKNGVAIWDLVTLEESVFVGPYAVFTNDFVPRAFLKRGAAEFRPTLLRRGVTVGANATIVCGVTIGEYALIGAGAVVTRSVPDHALIVGTPGRQVGRVCFCGQRLSPEDFCESCRCALSANSVERVQKSLCPAKG